MILKEDGVPITTTAGVEGPKLPIKAAGTSSGIFKRARLMKKKKLVQETLGITADILICDETDEFIFLE